MICARHCTQKARCGMRLCTRIRPAIGQKIILLRQIGRSQVDGDALGGEGQARCDQGRTDPLPAFRHGFVRQPHEEEGDTAGRDLDLNIHGARLDTLERHRRDPRHHPHHPIPQGEASGASTPAQEQIVNFYGRCRPPSCADLPRLSTGSSVRGVASALRYLSSPVSL
jgi:hypothetical protein